MTATNAAHPLFGHLQLSLCVLLLDVVVLHLHLMSELQPFLQGVRRRPAAARLQFLLCPLQSHTHLQVAPEKNQIRVQSRSSCKPHKATFRWEHFLIRQLRNRSYQLAVKYCPHSSVILVSLLYN